MPEDTNNRLCKLITDNLQLMLINVLIRYILSSKPVQGSVAARLS